MASIQFPQINRKLTAAIFLLLLSLTSFLNLLQSRLFETSEGEKLNQAVLQNPRLSRLHQNLGQYYLGSDREAAQREYELAQEYYTSESTPNPRQTWQKIEDKIRNLSQEDKYWEKVKEVYPYYLYAKLNLVIINLEKGETNKAKSYLTEVITQDPTNETAVKIWEQLK